MFSIWWGFRMKPDIAFTTVQPGILFAPHTRTISISLEWVVLGAHYDVGQGRQGCQSVLESVFWRLDPDHSVSLVALVLRKVHVVHAQFSRFRQPSTTYHFLNGVVSFCFVLWLCLPKPYKAQPAPNSPTLSLKYSNKQCWAASLGQHAGIIFSLWNWNTAKNCWKLSQNLAQRVTQSCIMSQTETILQKCVATCRRLSQCATVCPRMI